MCGLSGFSSKQNYNTDKIKMLIFWNAVDRGLDATGVFTPKSGIIKDNEPAPKFMNDKNKFGKLQPDNVLIAHTRKKSIGYNTVSNAHPFMYGNTVTAHNGTLSNYTELARKYGIKYIDYDTDSQVLANIIDKNKQAGEELKVLGEYKGYAALLSYDKDTEVLTACRDPHRPLFYGYIDQDMYISSIEESLKLIGCSDTKSFVSNKIYKIKAGEIMDIADYPTKTFDLEDVVLLVNPASTADIIDYSHGVSKPVLRYYKENTFTGFTAQSVKPKYLVGYRLRYTSFTIRYGDFHGKNVDCATLIKDQYYLVTGTVVGNNSKIMILDHTNKEKKALISDFDISYCIPIKGAYMKLLTPLWLVDDTRKLGEKDDVVKVNNHHWGSDKVNVVNEGTGETYNAPLENLVLISQKEVNEYLEELREYEEWKEETVYQRIMGDTNKEIVVSQQKLNLPAPSITEVTEEDMVDNDDLPFTNDCDSCDVPDKGPVETIEVNIAEYIDLDIYENFILDLVNKVEELQEKEFRKFPIDQDLENLVIHARNALDITYIESIY